VSVEGISVGDPVWVHTDGWAGRMRWRAVMVKVNPKRSRVRYLEEATHWRSYSGCENEEITVPNYAITARLADSGDVRNG
jgi:hypothetical protein